MAEPPTMDTRRATRDLERRRNQARRRRLLVRWLVVLACVVVIVVALVFALHGCSGSDGSGGSGDTSGKTTTTKSGGSSTTGGDGTATTATTADGGTSTTAGADAGLQPGDVRTPGSFYGSINTKFQGLTMFRGNGSRTYYGEGPLPTNPQILWRFGPMSGMSMTEGKMKLWTGTGWTGQPSVFERDGKTWVVVGCYDKKIHFFNADTGKEIIPPFVATDIFKGSINVDPDGYPIVYMGCRDGNWRAISFDRGKPVELWRLNYRDASPVIWNKDWDGNVVIRNDYAFIPGENSHFFIVKLNRGHDVNGKVTMNPKIVLDFPGWTAQELKNIGDNDVSIENSPALVGDRLYFSNSGGLIHGLDVSATLKKLAPGEAPPSGRAAFPEVFTYWDGDDTDSTIVVDEEGYLYVGIELQRFLPRAKQVGQIIKLDPRKNKPGENPLVWSVPVTKKSSDGLSGVWATVALYKDMVYVPTHPGSLLGIDRATGKIVWQKPFTEHAWSSVVVIDHTLVVGDTSGVLHAYDVSDTRVNPPEIWKFKIPSGGAIESTPAVWKGRIYVGDRDGYFYALGDK
ncbi:MAG TPA: PQQ-binding-like beta-propeller repeat protein [Thermoleophilia bacterium]